MATKTIICDVRTDVGTLGKVSQRIDILIGKVLKRFFLSSVRSTEK